MNYRTVYAPAPATKHFDFIKKNCQATRLRLRKRLIQLKATQVAKDGESEQMDSNDKDQIVNKHINISIGGEGGGGGGDGGDVGRGHSGGGRGGGGGGVGGVGEG